MRIKQSRLTPARQTRFLAVFLGALLVLAGIAQVIFLNSAPEPQYNKSKISQIPAPPAPVNVELKIVEEKRS